MDWLDAAGYNVLTDDLYTGWTSEVLSYLEPLKGDIPIFCVEYAQDAGGETLGTTAYSLAAAEGFVAYATRRSLSHLSTTPYPPAYTPHDY